MPQRNTHSKLVTHIKMALVVIKEINSTETEMFFFFKKKKICNGIVENGVFFFLPIPKIH